MYLHALINPHRRAVATFLGGRKLFTPGCDAVTNLLLSFRSSRVLFHHLEHRLTMGFSLTHMGIEKLQIRTTQIVLFLESFDKAFHRTITASFSADGHCCQGDKTILLP